MITKLILHCTATPNGQPLGTVSESAAQVVDRWHKQAGFRRSDSHRLKFNPHLGHIGYHFVIDTDGTVCTGRAESEVGAHCLGQNRGSLGISLVGTDHFTLPQWHALQHLVEDLLTHYGRVPIFGHNDFTHQKICPGFKVATWLAGDLAPLKGHIEGNYFKRGQHEQK